MARTELTQAARASRRRGGSASGFRRSSTAVTERLTLLTRTTTAGAVIELTGDLDHHTAPEVRTALAALDLRPGQQLALDLAGITFCNSTGHRADRRPQTTPWRLPRPSRWPRYPNASTGSSASSACNRSSPPTPPPRPPKPRGGPTRPDP
ncbi:STAS domain-containing protein [Streptomyces sp. NPDC006475]|uniref:STAS domain-containing protein n=1 Tax=Streptomyces sp. NPDC006475 TaxID=3155719 RepID=UPI0033B265B2